MLRGALGLIAQAGGGVLEAYTVPAVEQLRCECLELPPGLTVLVGENGPVGPPSSNFYWRDLNL